MAVLQCVILHSVTDQYGGGSNGSMEHPLSRSCRRPLWNWPPSSFEADCASFLAHGVNFGTHLLKSCYSSLVLNFSSTSRNVSFLRRGCLVTPRIPRHEKTWTFIFHFSFFSLWLLSLLLALFSSSIFASVLSRIPPAQIPRDGHQPSGLLH